MDGPHLTGNSPEPDGGDAASSSASSFASSSGSAQRGSPLRLPLHKGVRLRRRRRVVALASRGGGGDGGDGGGGCDDGVQDLALPLGMSFAAVLAQVLDKKNVSGERLPLDFLSKICTSAVKESLTNIYGDRFDSFMRNFEKSFGSTLRTLHLINETSVHEQRGTPQCSFKHDSVTEKNLSSVDSRSPIQDVEQNIFLNSVDNQLILHGRVNQQLAHISHSRSSPEFDQHILNTFERSVKEQAPQCSFKHDSVTEKNLSSVDSRSPIQEVEQNIFLNSVDNQLILHGRVNQQLAHIFHTRSSPEFDQHILNTFERSVKEQARSNELKEFEIGLNMRKLQLKQSQLTLSSYSHALEKIRISMGFQKASFKEKIFRTKMQDTRHAELLKMLIDFLVTAVIIMSVCFGYGTYIYSYQRITAVTSACAAASRETKSWWMPNSVSSFNSGLLFLRCHLIAITRMSFGILMILAIAWLIFQRSAMTGPNMPITFNLMLLGVLCGFAGRFCVDTLGGDGDFWLLCWEALCSIHLLGNIYPSFVYRVLHGPISVSHGTEVVVLPYWVRRYIFYAVLLLILPTSAGLLPFASLSDWKEHFVEKIKSTSIESKMEA